MRLVSVADFQDFKDFCAENSNSISNELSKIFTDEESRLSISEEDWKLICKMIFQTNITLLQRYHEWLSQKP